MPKTDKIEYDKRLTVIQGWIIDNHPSQLIDQQIILKGWCQSVRHAKRMRAEAWKRLSSYDVESVEERRNKKIFELEQRKRSMQPQYKGTPAGIRALIMVDKEIIKLGGLSAPIKLEHSGADGQPIQIQHVSNVDYSKLSSEVLRQITNARINPAI